jgi:hypothetical protein
MRALTVVTALVLALLCARCATMSNGPVQRVHVDSNPSAATVETSECGPGSTESATTPASISVSRRATRCQFVFKKPGYHDRTVNLTRRLSRDVDGRPKVLGLWCAECGSAEMILMSYAYVMLLVPSLAVDFATGSMYELAPPRNVVDLRPTPPAPAQQ